MIRFAEGTFFAQITICILCHKHAVSFYKFNCCPSATYRGGSSGCTRVVSIWSRRSVGLKLFHMFQG